MMTQGLSESRFFMWRAVFALAHADGVVSPEEAEWARGYLERLPLSESQKQHLQEDLFAPQQVGDMLMGVARPEDISDFFQFAHMMVWSDGAQDAREEENLARLTAERMNAFNLPALSQEIRAARTAAALRREMEDTQFHKDARQSVGIGAVFGALLPWMSTQAYQAPNDSAFRVWRAVFALAHADHVVTPEERAFIEGIMELFHFSEVQRALIADDNDLPKDMDLLFRAIADLEGRRQFFAMARLLVWVDGTFSEKERTAIARLFRNLSAEEQAALREDLAWLESRPVLPVEMHADDPKSVRSAVLSRLVQGMHAYADSRVV